MGSGAGEFGDGEGRAEVGDAEGDMGEGGERRYPGYVDFVFGVGVCVIGEEGCETLPPMTIRGQLHPPVYPPYPYPPNVPLPVRLGSGGRRIGGRRRRHPWGYRFGDEVNGDEEGEAGRYDSEGVRRP